MGKSRASIFDDADTELDISAFAPKSAPGADAPGPAREKVRAVSEANNFRSREAAPPKPETKSRREPRWFRTGRNVQLNLKASQETVDEFYAICEKHEWVMGYTLERAMAALRRELDDASADARESGAAPAHPSETSRRSPRGSA